MQFLSTLKTLRLQALLVPFVSSTAIRQRGLGPQCNEFLIPVTLSTTYNIAARYCDPEILVLHRQGTLQLLVHGGTHTRDYWYGDGAPGNGYQGDLYSWVHTASLNGYPTLAIDRIGSGNSSYPDPLGPDVSFSAQVEVLHQVIAAVQGKGPVLPLPHGYNPIVYVGHSYGSMLGDGLAAKYPNDVQALVLTGFSSIFTFKDPALAPNVKFLPANQVDPVRFGSLPDGYEMFANFLDVDRLFWWLNGFDFTLEKLDFSIRGTTPAAEDRTLPTKFPIATSYQGDVLVATGQHDAPFCSALGVPQNMTDCGTSTQGLVADVSKLFPAASSFEAYLVPDAGHVWQLHFTANEGFGVVHTWLNKLFP